MMENIFSLRGRTAVITGGLSGLGLAMTECMLAAGARVVVVSSNSEKIFVEKEKIYGDRLSYYKYDITDTEHIQDLVERILQEQGPIQILCNNAGNHCKKKIEDMTVEDFTRVLDVHLVGAFALTRAFVPHMKQQQAGNIIFIASMTSFIGQPYITGYATAKAGYLGMVHTLATELGESGIRVNAIAPGWIDTAMFRKATEHDPQRKAKIFGRIPMNKVGTPEDIGWAAVYLCSDAARYVSGICLPVDGGALIGF